LLEKYESSEATLAKINIFEHLSEDRRSTGKMISMDESKIQILIPNYFKLPFYFFKRTVLLNRIISKIIFEGNFNVLLRDGRRIFQFDKQIQTVRDTFIHRLYVLINVYITTRMREL